MYNQINSERNDIMNFYRTKLFDIISSFFIKYFTKYAKPGKNNKEIKDFLLTIDSKIDEIFSKFKLYIDKKYHINANDLETAFDIYIKEYMYSLLHIKIKYEKNNILYSFFKICCKKIAHDIYLYSYLFYNNSYNLHSSNPTSSNVYILEFIKIINNITLHQLNDIIPLNIITTQYLMIDKKQQEKEEQEQKQKEKEEQEHKQKEEQKQKEKERTNSDDDIKSKSNNDTSSQYDDYKSESESKSESKSENYSYNSEYSNHSEESDKTADKTKESEHEKIIHLPIPSTQYRKQSDMRKTVM